jgi:hypothetical protein
VTAQARDHGMNALARRRPDEMSHGADRLAPMRTGPISTLSPYLLYHPGIGVIARARSGRKIMGSAAEICQHA